MMKPIYLLCLFLASLWSCTQREDRFLTESEVAELSTNTLSMGEMNDFVYYPMIECKINVQEDKMLLHKILNISKILNTLAKDYIKLTGGVAVSPHILLNATKSGENGINLLDERLNKKELKQLLESVKLESDSSNESLVAKVETMINYHFLIDQPYFNNERLKSLPFSIISLKLSILERNINAHILDYMVKKDCKQKGS